jgi:Cu(I)/Ag(I) efflux system membrane fusion protein
MARASAAVAIALILYFSWSALSRKSPTRPAPTSAAAAQEKPGASPTMAAGKPPSQAAPAEAAAPSPPTVEIPVGKQQLLGMKTTPAQVVPLTKTIRTVGLVEYDQRRLNTITTKVEGWVEKLHVNFTGTYVKKGDPVADIYSPELWATQQEFINVVKWAKGAGAKSGTDAGQTTDGEDAPNIGAMISADAQSLVEAGRQRLRLFDITDGQIRRIEESEKPVRDLTIYSPYSGYVLQKNVNEGTRVMPGTDLFDVADLSTIWITADIYEFEMPLIKVGDTASVQLSYFPGRQFSTRIDYIYPTLQGEARTLKARFTMPNEGGRLKPQMFVNVELKINLGRKLGIPSDAVINTGLRQIAYVDKGDGMFEPREVVTGVRAGELVEITEGLKPGDRVVSSANFLIDSEAKLKGVEPLPRQAAPPAPAAHHR